MAVFLALFLICLKRRAPWTVRRGFYVMCIWYAVQRFAWEFLKPYPKVLGPLNLFHLICLILAAYGLSFYCLDRRRERSAAEESCALSVPGPDHQPV
jgi:prolipoprotein diacylglyceryltransferase